MQYVLFCSVALLYIKEVMLLSLKAYNIKPHRIWFVYIQLYKVSNEPYWEYAHPPLDYLQPDWQKEWRTVPPVCWMLCMWSHRKTFYIITRIWKEKEEKPPVCTTIVQYSPTVTFHQQVLVTVEMKMYFPFSAQVWITMSTFQPQLQRSLFLLHTSSKSKSISCC